MPGGWCRQSGLCTPARTIAVLTNCKAINLSCTSGLLLSTVSNHKLGNISLVWAVSQGSFADYGTSRNCLLCPGLLVTWLRQGEHFGLDWGSLCVLFPCSTPLLLWLMLQLGKAKERKEKKPGGQEGLRQVFCASVTSSQTAPAAGNEQLCHPAPQAIPNAWWPSRPLPQEAFLASCISKEGNTSGLGRPS